MLTLFRRLNAGEAVFDFIGSRKRWYWVSVGLLLICVGSFIFRGFNFGIEFSGGTSFQFRAAAAQPAQVQEVAEQAGAEVATPPAGRRQRRHPLDPAQDRRAAAGRADRPSRTRCSPASARR